MNATTLNLNQQVMTVTPADPRTSARPAQVARGARRLPLSTCLTAAWVQHLRTEARTAQMLENLGFGLLTVVSGVGLAWLVSGSVQFVQGWAGWVTWVSRIIL